MPVPAQRLLAFLALQERPLLRRHVAGTLWIDSTEDRAWGSLRSALWKVKRLDPCLIETTNHQLKLAPDVAVDVRDLIAWARRVGGPARAIEDDDLEKARGQGELLPDWYEGWVLIERERLRELHVHTLELLCERLMRASRLPEAMEMALTAAKSEPLRESAHRCVIAVHLAEGNVHQALRHYHLCRRLLGELGLEPSERMTDLIARAT